MMGKFLTIKSIRKYANRRPRKRCFPVGGRLLKTSRQHYMKRWKTVSLKPDMAEAKVQTTVMTTKCSATETDTHPNLVRTESRAQQTVCKKFQLQGTQTDRVMTSQGVQTEQHSVDQSHQTEWYLISTAAQTASRCNNVQAQTDRKWFCSIPVQTVDEAEDQDKERLQVEKEAVILLLNEIGEMIINQSHLMHNNSTLLQQITDMAMLNKTISAQNSAIKIREKFEKLRRIRRFLYKRRRTRYIFYKSEPKETSDVLMQTCCVQEFLTVSTQTYIKEFPKRKKSWMF